MNITRLTFVAVIIFFMSGCAAPTWEHEAIAQFQVPASMKDRLDKFFIENDLTGDVGKLQKFIEAGCPKIKIIGEGCTVKVIEILSREGREGTARNNKLSFFPENFIIKVHKHIPLAAGHPAWVFSCALRENVSRVFKAAEMRQVICAQQIKGVKVAQKYLYHIPGAPPELNDKNYLVVVEKFDLIPPGDGFVFRRATKQQAFDLFKVVMVVGYRDVSDENIAMDKNGDVVFVDTDEMELFALKEGVLRDDELYDLAFVCAQGIAQIFADIPTLKTIFKDNQKLCLKKALDKKLTGDDDRPTAKNIIKFYKNLCLIGAIKYDVERFAAADPHEILTYVFGEWVARVGGDYGLSEEDRRKLGEAFGL